MDKIKRYNPHFHPLADDVSFDESDDGDWVTYDDHAAEIASWQREFDEAHNIIAADWKYRVNAMREIADLRIENDRLRRALKGIKNLYEDGTIGHHRAREALK